MRPALAYILAVVIIGLVLGGVGRVVFDAVGWYKDQMTDPYRNLRKTAREAKKPRRTLEEIVNENHGAKSNDSEDAS